MHIQAKSTNFLRKQKNGYTTTLSDDESNEKRESEQANHVVAFPTCIRFISNVHNDGGSSDEEFSDDALVEAYNMLYLKHCNMAFLGRGILMETAYQKESHKKHKMQQKNFQGVTLVRTLIIQVGRIILTLNGTLIQVSIQSKEFLMLFKFLKCVNLGSLLH